MGAVVLVSLWGLAAAGGVVLNNIFVSVLIGHRHQPLHRGNSSNCYQPLLALLGCLIRDANSRMHYCCVLGVRHERAALVDASATRRAEGRRAGRQGNRAPARVLLVHRAAGRRRDAGTGASDSPPPRRWRWCQRLAAAGSAERWPGSCLRSPSPATACTPSASASAASTAQGPPSSSRSTGLRPSSFSRWATSSASWPFSLEATSRVIYGYLIIADRLIDGSSMEDQLADEP